jgi:DNA-nicking Smr family endonuclease
MAKLDELKALIEARRAAAAATKAATVAPGVHREPHDVPRRRDADAERSRPHAQPRPSPRRLLAAGKHADADVDIAQAFADVKRLPPRNQARVHRTGPAPIPRQRIADEEDALLASKYGAEPAPHSWDIGQEHEGEQTFLRKGLGSDVLAKLRRGHWSLQAELDLHGMTSEEAHDRLADFLLEARGRGLRCVRVIHGKGLTSPHKEPVLKGKVRRWLAHWDDVLAFCEAPRHAGGGGAVLVLLRGR